MYGSARQAARTEHMLALDIINSYSKTNSYRIKNAEIIEKLK